MVDIKKINKRKLKVRNKIKGVSDRPRLSVFRSNRYINAQVIDDNTGKTLVAVHNKEVVISKGVKLTKTQQAELVGKKIGEKALKNKIKSVVFDRGCYKFHGRVKSLAEGARSTGLLF